MTAGQWFLGEEQSKMTQNGALQKLQIIEMFCILTTGEHRCQNSSNVTLPMRLFYSCRYTPKIDFIKREKWSATSMPSLLPHFIFKILYVTLHVLVTTWAENYSSCKQACFHLAAQTDGFLPCLADISVQLLLANFQSYCLHFSNLIFVVCSCFCFVLFLSHKLTKLCQL